jgi:hypothetical protein
MEKSARYWSAYLFQISFRSINGASTHQVTDSAEQGLEQELIFLGATRLIINL